jgi:formamidopyrimidine-DNA glycosylase
MPELPEAETIVRGLRPSLRGRRLGRTEVIHSDVVEGEAGAFTAQLQGRPVREVGRRGKNVILRLGGVSGGGNASRGDDLLLVVNLGMSGRLLFRPLDDPRPPPSHPAVRTQVHGMDGTPAGALVYHDPRRFGRLQLLPPEAFRRWSGSLGPEPLSRGFTARRLEDDLLRSSSPVRSWLLDQRRVAGVGNIYANEALFLARIHPQTPGFSVGVRRARSLHRALRRVLREAVASRGTTLRDYRTADGGEGSYAVVLRVYGREGEPCLRCGTRVERTVFGNRSAFLCPRCQPRPDP